MNSSKEIFNKSRNAYAYAESALENHIKNGSSDGNIVSLLKKEIHDYSSINVDSKYLYDMIRYTKNNWNK